MGTVSGDVPSRDIYHRQMLTRQKWLGATLIGVALIASGCAGSPDQPAPSAAPPRSEAVKNPQSAPARTLLLKVEGDGTMTAVTYTINGKPTTFKDLHVPWTKSVSVPRSGDLEFSLDIKIKGGTITAQALLDGTLLTSGGAGGSGDSTSSLHLSGSSTG